MKRKVLYETMPSENALMCARQSIEDELMAAYDNFFDKVKFGEPITAQDITSLKLNSQGMHSLSTFLKERGLE